MNAIYTFGYQAKQPADLLAKLVELDGVLCDIRFSPRSRFQPGWNKGRLAELMGDRYIHLADLGNLNYTGGEIEIVDLSAGLGTILKLAEKRPVVLMCVCSKLVGCHRETVAHALHERGISTEELDLNPTPSLFTELTAA